MAKMTESQAMAAKVLAALEDAKQDDGDFPFLNFAAIARRVGTDDKAAVRRACRFLSRKGKANFGKGLMTEDGELYGSGYSAAEE